MADDAVPPAVRAQLLATEHWGLLAARGTAQSEVLTRISMFLTLVSAALVSLALIGQATDFSEAFLASAVAVVGFVCIVGVLTQIRVINVALEDLMYVLAMNRLRAAYVSLDPGISPYLMTSPHDDLAGSARTYYFLGARTTGSQVGGSSMVFIIVVNSALIGLFVAAALNSLEAPGPLLVSAGVVCGAVFLVVSVMRGGLAYRGVWRTHVPVSPTREA